ncbi:MAG: hypothetical protein JO128_15705 [Alphaproteobacteria bacterium]|nr:hypothetical protein [Alphaproteobacteria bacterium]
MVRSIAVFAVACSVAVALAVQARADCYTPAESAAVHVRMLQSELMVAALACRDSNPELGMIAGYNDFVRRLSPSLVRNSKLLQSHFRKTYGSAGEHRFEAFETALANAASKQSMASSTYCENSATLFQQVAVLQASDLEQFSSTRAVNLGMALEACSAEKEKGLRLTARQADR